MGGIRRFEGGSGAKGDGFLLNGAMDSWTCRDGDRGCRKEAAVEAREDSRTREID